MKNVFLSLLVILSVNASQAETETAQKLQGTWLAGTDESIESKVIVYGNQLTWVLTAAQCMKTDSDGSCLYAVNHLFINSGTFNIVGDSEKVQGGKVMQVKFHGIGNPFFGPLSQASSESDDIKTAVDATEAKDFELDVLLAISADGNELVFGSLETTLEDAFKVDYLESGFTYKKIQ